jgi:hypothetical protein
VLVDVLGEIRQLLKIWRSDLAYALVFGRDQAVDTSPNVHAPTQPVSM